MQCYPEGFICTGNYDGAGSFSTGWTWVGPTVRARTRVRVALCRVHTVACACALLLGSHSRSRRSRLALAARSSRSLARSLATVLLTCDTLCAAAVPQVRVAVGHDVYAGAGSDDSYVHPGETYVWTLIAHNINNENCLTTGSLDCDGANFGGWSNYLEGAQEPATPDVIQGPNFGSPPTNQTSLVLTWNSPEDNGGVLTSYRVSCIDAQVAYAYAAWADAHAASSSPIVYTFDASCSTPGCPQVYTVRAPPHSTRLSLARSLVTHQLVSSRWPPLIAKSTPGPDALILPPHCPPRWPLQVAALVPGTTYTCQLAARNTISSVVYGWGATDVIPLSSSTGNMSSAGLSATWSYRTTEDVFVYTYEQRSTLPDCARAASAHVHHRASRRQSHELRCTCCRG